MILCSLNIFFTNYLLTLLYREAATFCFYCGVKARRDGLDKHCSKIHGATTRALKVGETPLRPKYSNWDKYKDDPFRVFPEVDPSYEPR